MSKLEILTFLHILGAFLIVAGASVGAATGIAMTRTTSVRAIGLLARISRQAELMAIVPGALIAIVFGTWLVVDLADPTHPAFVICGGNSSRPGSPHLTDMLPLWLAGDYATVRLERDELDRSSESVWDVE